MKSTLLILIGYITCTLKCEMYKTGAEEKTDNVKPLNEKGQQGDVQQPKDAVLPEGEEATDAGEPPDDEDRPVNVEQPENVEETDAADTTDAGDTTYAVEQLVDTEQPEDTEKTVATKKQKIQAGDTGPSKIRVEDALKILEKSKNRYASESIALIKKLNWLRSTFNIKELMIDHKIDPNEDFDDLSDKQNSFNTSNILRKRVKDGFAHIKQAIMDASNFNATEDDVSTSNELYNKEKMAKVKAEAKRYKTSFIATHSDRESLEKIYLAYSDKR